MDSQCTKPILSCSLCKEDDHGSCCQESLVPLDVLVNGKITIVEDAATDEKVRQINAVMDAKMKKLDKILRDIKQMTYEMVSLRLTLHADKLLEPGILEMAKKDYSVKYCAEQSKVLFTAKQSSVLEEIEKLGKKMADGVHSCTRNFLAGLQRLQGQAYDCTFSADDWVHGKNTKIEKTDSGLIFNTKDIGSSCAINMLPLKTACRYKVSIISLDLLRRRVELGVIQQKEIKNFKDKFEMDYTARGAISYSGYNHDGEPSGMSITRLSIGPNKHTVGSHFIMEFRPGESVRFYNEEGTLNITKSITPEDGVFHLFVNSNSRANVFLLKRLD